MCQADETCPPNFYDYTQIFAAEFFSRRLTLHRLRRGSVKEKRLPQLIASQVIDKSLGPAYSVVLADLRGEGRHTHVLVSSHECAYASLDDQGGEYYLIKPSVLHDWHSKLTIFVFALSHVLLPSPFQIAGLSHAPSKDSNSKSQLVNSNSKGGSLYSYEIPREWKSGGYRWRRRTIATGFQVRTWGQLNPGAPGFPYTFYPHKSMEKQKGSRPYILLAGDCSHAAYVFRPIGGQDGLDYDLWAEINCGGTVGSLAVTHLPLFTQDHDSTGGKEDGWAKLFIPNFDANKVSRVYYSPST